jgi:Sec-independent protein translocase protein TatA
MKYQIVLLWAFVEALALKSCLGFVLPAAPNQGVLVSGRTSDRSPGASTFQNYDYQQRHLSLRRQRMSVANVQTMGLFGLGAPEVVIILVVAAVLIGPQNLGNMAGNFAGKLSTEFDDLPEDLKKIPKEFQKGVEEGEVNARARQAKPMEPVPKETEASKKKDD